MGITGQLLGVVDDFAERLVAANLSQEQKIVLIDEAKAKLDLAARDVRRPPEPEPIPEPEPTPAPPPEPAAAVETESPAE